MTAQQTLIELRLGTDLTGFISRERAAGKGWRPIATEISERTGIQVSHETVRKWHIEASLSRGVA